MKGLYGEDKQRRGSLGNGGALMRRFASQGAGFDAANSLLLFFGLFFSRYLEGINKKGVRTRAAQVRKPGKGKSG